MNSNLLPCVTLLKLHRNLHLGRIFCQIITGELNEIVGLTKMTSYGATYL